MEKLRFKVIIKGAGDPPAVLPPPLAVGVDVLMLELPQPLSKAQRCFRLCRLRRNDAWRSGSKACRSDKEIAELLSQRIIPVLVDPQGEISQV